MLIKNGTIIDGTGKPRYNADVRIGGDRIEDIGHFAPAKREISIDATGKFVTPGFVDILNRSDTHFSLFDPAGFRSLLKQGVTTVLGGGCGASLAPVINGESIKALQKWEDVSKANINWATTKEFLNEVERHNLGVNFATLTGHATLRRGIIGDNFEKLSLENLKKLEYLLEESIAEGSFGLSLGLSYSHEKAADQEELEHFANVVKKNKGVLAAHLRDEGKGLLQAVDEIISIAAKCKISTHIYHFKGFGRESWGVFPRALENIERARSEGVNITFDAYPYDITSSVLYLLLPDWVSYGGKSEVVKRLRDKSARQKIVEEMAEKIGDFENIIIARGDIDPIFIGATLKEIAAKQEVGVIEALLNMILASEDRLVGFMPFINERNMEIAITAKCAMIASDGGGHKITEKKIGMLTHPRSFGAFPKFLREFTREKNILSWEEAIYKITLLPAEKIGLYKRGQLARGYFADLVIFDPEKIRDNATFKDPFQYAEGMGYVLVNGGFALRRGKLQKGRYGKVLRK